MKRIGWVLGRILDPDNLRLAFWKASRGKRHRADQREWQDSLEERIEELRMGIENLTYPVGEYRRFTIYEPKEREICAAAFGERVLHHAIMNICEPYFDRWLVADTFACRKGKGQSAAVDRAAHFARHHEWFMKCDFRKYFDSIPHDGVRRMLERRFKDPGLLEWFWRIVGAYEKTPGRGVPIGNLTSQHLANLYLDPLDRMPRFGCGYVRYMDDFVFWADRKETLLELRRRVSDFSGETLGLELKREPFINRTAAGMEFLGMRIYRSAVYLSRRSRVRYGRKVRACERLFEKGELCEAELQRRVTSLTAFVSGADSLVWRRHNLAVREGHRAITGCCAAAAGTTMRRTAAPRTATGTSPATATTTTASASSAPQHRRTELRAVPAGGRIPCYGTNSSLRPDASSGAESFRAESISVGGAGQCR